MAKKFKVTMAEEKKTTLEGETYNGTQVVRAGESTVPAFEKTCLKCGCKFIYISEAIKHDRDGDYVICPSCGAFISHQETLKTINFIPPKCTSDAKCEDRSQKHSDSITTLEEEIKAFIDEYGYERGEDKLLIAIVARHFAEWQKKQDDIIGKAISYFGAESLLDNANGLTDFEKFTAWLYCEFLRGLPKKLNQDYIKEQSKVILGAIRKKLGKMPDSTELIAQWDAERKMLEQKDFRGNEWRLAQNAFFDGFGYGCFAQREQMLKGAVEVGETQLFWEKDGDRAFPTFDPPVEDLLDPGIMSLKFEEEDKVKIIIVPQKEEKK